VSYAVCGLRSKYSESLHAKYGPVVRTKPNEISFIGENAWKDIYMHRQGHKQMAKAGRSAGISILVVGDEAHARQRRLLSHAFSERAASAE
jgi:cytochrome P450